MWWYYIINSFKPWRLGCPPPTLRVGGQGAATKAMDRLYLAFDKIPPMKGKITPGGPKRLSF